MKQFKNRDEYMDWYEKFLENYHNSLGLDPVEALLHFPSDEEYFSALRADGYDAENPVSNPDGSHVEYRVSFVNGDVIAQFVTPDFISREDAMRIAGIEICCDRDGTFARYNGKEYYYESIVVEIVRY